MDIDFSFYLLVGSVVSGLIWSVYLLKLKAEGTPYAEDNEPWVVEYARSFFPVLLLVLLLRSFLAEPFRIPSGSMMPTLLVGDFILVNKFAYGIRLPVINKKIIGLNEPKRGDIVVFRYPRDPSVDYIKRVIGLPGDKISYDENKQLTVNGIPVKQVSMGLYQGLGSGQEMTGAERLQEDLTGIEHNILIRHDAPTVSADIIVPEGQYFMMGDNRDNSNDSRYWGTVPEENLVGRAMLIWMNFDGSLLPWDFHIYAFQPNRIGTLLK